VAESIAERDGITEGIICVISAVESCMSFHLRKSFKTKTIEMYRRERKCLHHDLYLIDPEFGFMHVRIQGWIPSDCQISINGREWLARRLDQAGIGSARWDNALVKTANLEAACELGERFAHRAWPGVLNAFARRVNPIMAAVRAAGYGGYSWVPDQAEIATDVMFSTRSTLLGIWPDLIRHAADFDAHRGFTFTVLEPVTGDVIGCVYLYPSQSADADVTVQSWVRASQAELDVPLADAVAAWLTAEWPWKRVHRLGR
jgi:hypothetical protein